MGIEATRECLHYEFTNENDSEGCDKPGVHPVEVQDEESLFHGGTIYFCDKHFYEALLDADLHLLEAAKHLYAAERVTKNKGFPRLDRELTSISNKLAAMSEAVGEAIHGKLPMSRAEKIAMADSLKRESV